MTAEQELQDEVFKHVYIPRTLQELTLEEIQKQQKENSSLFSKLTGIEEQSTNENKDLALSSTGAEVITEDKRESESDKSEGSEESSDGGSSSEDEEGIKKGSVSLKGMTKEQMKEHKRLVKEEKREKRKNKIPKPITKKAEKKNKK